MVLKWEVQTYYGYGSIVEFEGHKYKIIQPHQSQADWTPTVTPALWSRLPEEYDCSDHEGYHASEKVDGSCPPQQQVQIQHEEQKKNWWDLDEHRKKELEIGGGLFAGAALIAGGVMAYKHHQSEQEKKAAVWDLQAWFRDAQARTDQYYREGPKAPVTWVLNKGRNMPKYAIEGGSENGSTFYVARAFSYGGVHPGKCGSHLSRGASIASEGEEVETESYEVLIGKSDAVRWVEVSGQFSLQQLQGSRPVEGGREKDGTLLYVAQASFSESIHPGKVSEKMNGCHFSYGGVEKVETTYSVLVYN